MINDVRGAVRQIDTDIKRIEAARATMRLADERLKAEQKKYAVGLSTTHDLLEFQDELAKAESRYAFAKASYEQNLADLARVKGMLLLRVFDQDNRAVLESKPKKTDLKPGDSYAANMPRVSCEGSYGKPHGPGAE